MTEFFPHTRNSVVEQGRYSLNSVDDLYVLWCLSRPEDASPSRMYAAFLEYVKAFIPFCDTRNSFGLPRENEPIMVALMLKFAVSSNRVDCIVAAKSWWTPKTVLTSLASTSSDETVAWELVANVNTPPQGLRILAGHEIASVRREVLAHQNVNRAVLEQYEQDPVPRLRLLAAAHPLASAVAPFPPRRH